VKEKSEANGKLTDKIDFNVYGADGFFAAGALADRFTIKETPQLSASLRGRVSRKRREKWNTRSCLRAELRPCRGPGVCMRSR